MELEHSPDQNKAVARIVRYLAVRASRNLQLAAGSYLIVKIQVVRKRKCIGRELKRLRARPASQ